MIKHDPSLGELERVIKQLLREDRFSFSEEEKHALGECLKLIKDAEEGKDKRVVQSNKELAMKILINLLRVLATGFDGLENIF